MSGYASTARATVFDLPGVDDLPEAGHARRWLALSHRALHVAGIGSALYLGAARESRAAHARWYAAARQLRSRSVL